MATQESQEEFAFKVPIAAYGSVALLASDVDSAKKKAPTVADTKDLEIIVDESDHQRIQESKTEPDEIPPDWPYLKGEGAAEFNNQRMNINSQSAIQVPDGEDFKRFRENINFTREKVADDLGVSAMTIFNWEMRNTLSLKKARRYADYLYRQTLDFHLEE